MNIEILEEGFEVNKAIIKAEALYKQIAIAYLNAQVVN